MEVRRILALSNGVAWWPAWCAWKTGNTGSAYLIMLTACASFAMHLSETKHGMHPGGWLELLSPVLLNIDRAAALATAAWFGVLWWVVGMPSLPAAVLSVGAVCSYLGEQTQSLPHYCVLHLLWHGAAYLSVYMVIAGT